MITWIDIMILVILLICIILGTFRGIMKSFFLVVKFAGAIAVSKILSPMLSRWIIANTSVTARIENLFKVKGSMPDTPNAVSGSVDAVTNWFESLNMGIVPQKIINFFANLWDKGATAAGHAANTAIAVTAGSIVKFATFVVLFILMMIVLSLLIRALDIMEKLPVIKKFNRIGGFLLGLIKGIAINMIVVSVMFVIAMFLTSSPINIALQSSILAPYFYIGYILF